MASGGQKNFDEYDITDDNVTTELVIKPRKPAYTIPDEDRESLNNMTKRMICDRCVEQFGIELNFRTEKKLLITEFLDHQTTYN